MRRGSRRLAILMVLGAAANGLLAAGGPVPQLLLDGAVVGRGVFAVGERGAILHSTTAGRSWEPLASHTGATLTGISFAPDGQHGWVVGHEAVIVATADGGKTWHTQPAGENRQDSFLDVLAIDARQAIAIGAYGLFVRTADGGKTWSREKVIEEDFHLNRITRGPTGTLYVAGEHGTLLRSTNAGAKWVPIPAPYEGSFYGILPLEDGQLLAYGLRGHVFRSGNDGAAWEPVPAPQPVLVATAL